MKFVEQETVVVYGVSEDVVRIYSTVPKHIRALDKNPRAERRDGDAEYGNFVVPTSEFDPLRGFKRKSRVMTPAEKEAASERLRKAREARNG